MTSTATVHIVTVGLHDLRHLLDASIPNYRAKAHITLIEKAYEDALSAIQLRSREAPIDAIVAAGSNGHFLRRHLDIPVVLVRVNGFDVMHGLACARNSSDRIALVTYEKAPEEFAHFMRMFDVAVSVHSYRSEEEAYLTVRELKAQGVDTVVAPGLVVDLARRHGLQGVLLYSQQSVNEALDDAVEVGWVRRSEHAKRERINAILGELRDGVVAVDTEGCIDVLNPAMEKILGKSSRQLIGKPLEKVAEEFDLQETLQRQMPDLERIQKLQDRTVVTSRVPITEQGRLTGAVLICQDPETIRRMDRSLRTRRSSRARNARYGLDDIVGNTPAMSDVKARVLACARSQATVLIVGESGTGKELIAHSIHQESARRDQPFIAVNCGAFPASLLESELFGYTEGSFTGASRAGKVGLFEAAHTGTLFLDEIGEMPLSLQTRLLRVLQEREVLRIGATEPVPVDVRIIAATHQDLSELVADRRFRQDLYYRLNILLIKLAPLRERLGDLPLLIEALQHKLSSPSGGPRTLDPTMLKALIDGTRKYHWPGNIRELENVLERLMVLGNLYGAHEPPCRILERIAPELLSAKDPALISSHEPGDKLREQRLWSDRQLIQRALQDSAGNQTEAARQLNISRSTLWRRMKQLGIK